MGEIRKVEEEEVEPSAGGVQQCSPSHQDSSSFLMYGFPTLSPLWVLESNITKRDSRKVPSLLAWAHSATKWPQTGLKQSRSFNSRTQEATDSFGIELKNRRLTAGKYNKDNAAQSLTGENQSPEREDLPQVTKI